MCALVLGLAGVASAGVGAGELPTMEKLLGELRSELTIGPFAARQEHADTRIDAGEAPVSGAVLKSPRSPDVVLIAQFARQVCACVFDGSSNRLRRVYTFQGNKGYRLDDDGGRSGQIEFTVFDQSADGYDYAMRVILRYADSGYEMTRTLAGETNAK